VLRHHDPAASRGRIRFRRAVEVCAVGRKSGVAMRHRENFFSVDPTASSPPRATLARSCADKRARIGNAPRVFLRLRKTRCFLQQ
jgi:hypothetical protein